jgi:hypothetical protein
MPVVALAEIKEIIPPKMRGRYNPDEDDEAGIVDPNLVGGSHP